MVNLIHQPLAAERARLVIARVRRDRTSQA